MQWGKERELFYFQSNKLQKKMLHPFLGILTKIKNCKVPKSCIQKQIKNWHPIKRFQHHRTGFQKFYDPWLILSTPTPFNGSTYRCSHVTDCSTIACWVGRGRKLTFCFFSFYKGITHKDLHPDLDPIL